MLQSKSEYTVWRPLGSATIFALEGAARQAETTVEDVQQRLENGETFQSRFNDLDQELRFLPDLQKRVDTRTITEKSLAETGYDWYDQ